MNGIEPARSVVKSILVEHRELHHAVADIKTLLAWRNSDVPLSSSYELLSARLFQLRHHLAEHFEREEKGGFLEEAVTRLPRLAKQVIALEKEHPELLRNIDALLDLILQEAPTNAGWQRLTIEFDRVAQQLAAHEVAESYIVKEGFNQDSELRE